MSISMLNLILWAPFVAVCVLWGIFYIIAGYRKGMLNALISLGGTLVSALAGLGIAKLIAPLLAPAILKAISFPESELSDSVLGGLIDSAAAMAVAIVLFSLLMLIITPICKKILKVLLRLPAGGKAMKWGGLAVRAVDAVLFAFLLLLPIYGTLHNYLPAANAIMQIQPEYDETTIEYINAAQTHPVVTLSGVGPADWVYRGLSQLNSGAISVNATTLTSTIEDMAALLRQVNQGADSTATLKELFTYVKDNLIEEQWCSELIVNVGIDYLSESLGDDFSVLTDAISELDISPEQFRQDGKDILDLAIGVIDLQSASSFDDAATAELTQKLGEVLTSNETVKQLKTQVYTKAVTQYLNDDSQETQAAIREQINSAELTDHEQLAEAQVFLQLLTGESTEDALNALAELGILSDSLLSQS